MTTIPAVELTLAIAIAVLSLIHVCCPWNPFLKRCGWWSIFAVLLLSSSAVIGVTVRYRPDHAASALLNLSVCNGLIAESLPVQELIHAYSKSENRAKRIACASICVIIVAIQVTGVVLSFPMVDLVGEANIVAHTGSFVFHVYALVIISLARRTAKRLAVRKEKSKTAKPLRVAYRAGIVIDAIGFLGANHMVWLLLIHGISELFLLLSALILRSHSHFTECCEEVDIESAGTGNAPSNPTEVDIKSIPSGNDGNLWVEVSTAVHVAHTTRIERNGLPTPPPSPDAFIEGAVLSGFFLEDS